MKFTILSMVVLAASVIGTYLIQLTDRIVIEYFYKPPRPFRFWGPLRHKLPDKVCAAVVREHCNGFIALPLTLRLRIAFLLPPMQLIICTFDTFLIAFTIFIPSMVGMYFFRCGNLPQHRIVLTPGFHK